MMTVRRIEKGIGRMVPCQECRRAAVKIGNNEKDKERSETGCKCARATVLKAAMNETKRKR